MSLVGQRLAASPDDYDVAILKLLTLPAVGAVVRSAAIAHFLRGNLLNDRPNVQTT